MRKTRLVIQKTRCLHTIGFLLLYLSCPVIGDWGRIQPDTDMAHRAVAVQREGARTLIKDPPSLGRRGELDGFQRRPSETLAKALKTNQHQNRDVAQPTRPMTVSDVEQPLLRRQAVRWLDARNQRLSTETRANRVSSNLRNARRDDVIGERESRRADRISTLSLDARQRATRAESVRATKRFQRLETHKLRRTEQADNRLEANRQTQMKESTATATRQIRVENIRDREENHGNGFYSRRMVEGAERRDVTHTMRLQNRGQENALGSRRLLRTSDADRNVLNRGRQETRRNATPMRRLVRETRLENNNHREQAVIRGNNRQLVLQERQQGGNTRANNEQRREGNSQRRLLKARRSNEETRIESSRRQRENVDSNRKDSATRRNSADVRLLRRTEHQLNSPQDSTTHRVQFQSSNEKRETVSNNDRNTVRESERRNYVTTRLNSRTPFRRSERSSRGESNVLRNDLYINRSQARNDIREQESRRKESRREALPNTLTNIVARFDEEKTEKIQGCVDVRLNDNRALRREVRLEKRNEQTERLSRRHNERKNEVIRDSFMTRRDERPTFVKNASERREMDIRNSRSVDHESNGRETKVTGRHHTAPMNRRFDDLFKNQRFLEKERIQSRRQFSNNERVLIRLRRDVRSYSTGDDRLVPQNRDSMLQQQRIGNAATRREEKVDGIERESYVRAIKNVRNTFPRNEPFSSEKAYPQAKVGEMLAGTEKWGNIREITANCVLGAMVWYLTSRQAKILN